MASVVTLAPSPLLLSSVPGVAAAYLGFAVGLGPRFMKSREPLRLKPLVAVYNALQVMLNALLLRRSVLLIMDDRYQLTCPPSLPAFDDALATLPGGVGDFAQEMMLVAFSQMLLRVFDLLDTVFIVLAKKNSNLTFLHLYHHASVILTCWYILKIDAGASFTLVPAAVNNFVHMTMYSYYLSSLFGFQFVRVLKKYITKLQIIQFVVVFIYVCCAALRNDCSASKLILLINFGQTIAFLGLFLNFYNTSYRPKKKT